ncbi:hypothetical protein DFP73DRAFT_592007 [Morchella snyderi]|nr:hypothetical protein DFP73DRAFT_592007 [Morchella snyderi]
MSPGEEIRALQRKVTVLRAKIQEYGRQIEALGPLAAAGSDFCKVETERLKSGARICAAKIDIIRHDLEIAMIAEAAMHRLIEFPVLHMKLYRLHQRLAGLHKKLENLHDAIDEYNSQHRDERPNVVMEAAMYEKEADIMFKIDDVKEDVNILESRIMTLKSQKERKKRDVPHKKAQTISPNILHSRSPDKRITNKSPTITPQTPGAMSYHHYTPNVVHVYDNIRFEILNESLCLHRALLSLITSEPSTADAARIRFFVEHQRILNLQHEALCRVMWFIKWYGGIGKMLSNRKMKGDGGAFTELIFRSVEMEIKRVKHEIRQKGGIVFDTKSAVPGKRPSRMAFWK